MKLREALTYACATVGIVYHALGDYSSTNDCFCGQKDFSSSDERFQRYVREAALQRLREDGISEDRIREACDRMESEYLPPTKRTPPARWSVVEVSGPGVSGWAMFDSVTRTTGTIHEYKSDAEAQLRWQQGANALEEAKARQKAWRFEDRVRALEAEGASRSDAQAVAEAEGL